MKKKNVSPLLIALVTAITMNLHAALEVIQIDFGDSGTPAGNWNEITGAAINGLTPGLDDFRTGNSTDVDVTGSFTFPFATTSGTTGGFNGTQDWVDPVVVLDFIAGSDDSSNTLTFSGLTGDSYNIEVVAAGNFAGGTTTDLQVDGNFADRNFLGGANLGDNWHTVNDGLTPGNWLIWDDVAPTGGDITVGVPAGGGIVQISALRIADAAVPEPGTYVMFATLLAAAAYLKLRRHRKQGNEKQVKAAVNA